MLVKVMLVLGSLGALDEHLPGGRRVTRRPRIAHLPAAVRAVAA